MLVKTIRLYTLALILSDTLAILGAFSIAYILRVQFDPRPLINQISALNFFISFLILTPFWLIIFLSLNLYSPETYRRRLREMSKLLIGSFLGILLVIGYAFVVNKAIFPARLVAVYALGITFIFLICGREFLRMLNGAAFRHGRGIQRVLLIGKDQAAKDIAYNLKDSKTTGFEIVAITGSRVYHPNATLFRSPERALQSLKELKIDSIIQTQAGSEEQDRMIYDAATKNHVGYSFIPGNTEFYTGKNTMDVFLGYPLITLYQTPLVGWGETAKRVFDLSAVIITLPIWGVLFLIIAVLQKIFNPGPIFYKSARLTRYSRKFSLFKFRSMKDRPTAHLDAADEFRMMGREDLAKEYDKHRKVENDPRISAFGNFLRKTSLDELPQLLNVLGGDLSLVGPRPILPQELELTDGHDSLLHSVKSGVTGLWQVSGRNSLSFQKRVELELYYAQNWSFAWDIRILFKTITVVLFGRGAK